MKRKEHTPPSTALKEFKELHKLIDRIYAEAYDRDWSWEQLAAAAGVGVGTVYNLGNEITQYPRLQTVFCLARAVGLELVLKAKFSTRLKVVG